MIRFDNNEFLSFDFLRRIGNINSHAISTLQSSKHTIESFVVLQALNCILFLLRALLKQMDINLDDFEPFSSKPYPNVQHQESRIISKKCQKTIDDNNFRAVNSFEINRVTICSLLYQEHTIYKVPIYQRGYE
jgi:hypothetical protein